MPKSVSGLAAPFPPSNVDTDVIMPKRFLRTITREGLGEGTLADLRFDEERHIRPDFILNRAPWNDASILIVGDNFGCGSSREHAVWGLKQMGIGGVIGTGFAGIFFDNARKNGLALPIVPAALRDDLLALASHEDGLTITIDIAEGVLRFDNQVQPFTMDDATTTALLEDRDDTLDSLKLADQIRKYETGLTEKMRVKVIA